MANLIFLLGLCLLFCPTFILSQSLTETLRDKIFGEGIDNDEKMESNRTTIKFVLTIPFFMGTVLVASPYLALQRLRSMENWLPNYDVDIEWIDDQCTSEVYVNEIGKRLRHPNNPQTDYQ